MRGRKWHAHGRVLDSLVESESSFPMSVRYQAEQMHTADSRMPRIPSGSRADDTSDTAAFKWAQIIEPSGID